VCRHDVDDGKMSGKGPIGGRGGSENQVGKDLVCLHAWTWGRGILMQAVQILAHKGIESRGSLLHHLQMLRTDSLDLEEVRS